MLVRLRVKAVGDIPKSSFLSFFQSILMMIIFPLVFHIFHTETELMAKKTIFSEFYFVRTIPNFSIKISQHEV